MLKENNLYSLNIHPLLSRFLCGGSALRGGKTQNFRTLFTGICCPELASSTTHQLIKEITFYNKAVSTIANEKISIKTLAKAHSILVPQNRQRGKIRRTQNAVQNDIGEIIFTPPSVSQLHELLPDFEAELATQISTVKANGSGFNEALKTLYIQLQYLHLFSDGNGRTGRAFLDGIQQKFGILKLNPVLYRIGKTQQDYNHLIQSYSLNNPHKFSNNFWGNALDWRDSLEKSLNKTIEKTNTTLFHKSNLFNITQTHIDLVKMLWSRPIINIAMLSYYLKIDTEKSQKLIEDFIDLSILQAELHSHNKRTQLFICPDILSAYQKFENQIIKNQPL